MSFFLAYYAALNQTANYFWSPSLPGTRQSRSDIQHRDSGHQRKGDNHSGERRQISFGPIHQKRGQCHFAGGQLAHQ